jgi:DNA-binding transcriptional LysR family regulator
MAVASLGIAPFPQFQAAPFVAAGQLAPVLPGWSRSRVEVRAIMPSTCLTSATARAFIDPGREGTIF